MKVEQIPRVLNWGSAPFSVSIRSGKPVVYTHDMELEVTLTEDLVFVETLRILDGVTEHRFACENTVGDWRSVRVQAFQDCVGKAGKTLPLKRLVIFGASHQTIQQGILERFPESLDAIHPAADVDTDAKRVKRANGKRINWGDAKEAAVEGPCESHPYGGWGLVSYCIIPNRWQLMEMVKSVAERQVESDDLDDYSFDEEVVDDFVESHFSIFNDEEGEEPTIEYDDQTSEEKVETSGEDEDDTDPDSPDTDPLMHASDSDDEVPVNYASRKRVKLEPMEESDKVFREDESENTSSSAQPKAVASCRPVEDELREIDFWLLENIA